jgi:RNA polymerase sigma-70 factor (ECF subfamily)
MSFFNEWWFCLVKDYSDEELMNFTMSGDGRAFEELFRRYQRRLFGFFYGLLLNAEESRDCVQETFLRLWQRRTQFANKGRFSAYLFQIAKNHFLDRNRKQKSHIDLQRSSGEELTESLHHVSSSEDGHSEATIDRIRGAVSDAMSRLPEMQRLVYVLSEEQRMSYKDIADILDCPVGTVSSRKVEAVKKLREFLRPLRDELFGRGSTGSSLRVGSNDDEVSK